MVRQTDYIKTALKRRIAKQRCIFAASATLHGGLRNPVFLYCALKAKQKADEACRSLQILNHRRVEISTTAFNLNAWDDMNSMQDFRFTVNEIDSKIVPFINFTRLRTKRNRYRCDTTFAAFVILRRLASACRWSDLSSFHRYGSQLSEIFWEVMKHMQRTKFYLVTESRADLMESNEHKYASAISTIAPLHNCVGFLDCTIVRVCRPKGENVLERSLYNGHKSTHCIKFQTITTPYGLCFHIYGPEE